MNKFVYQDKYKIMKWTGKQFETYWLFLQNLEDNYGAVISANHEALAQILEQVYVEY